MDNSGALFDVLKARYGLETDAQLAKCIGANPVAVSKIRHGRMRVSAALILSVHKNTGIPVTEIEGLITPGGKEK